MVPPTGRTGDGRVTVDGDVGGAKVGTCPPPFRRSFLGKY